MCGVKVANVVKADPSKNSLRSGKLGLGMGCRFLYPRQELIEEDAAVCTDFDKSTVIATITAQVVQYAKSIVSNRHEPAPADIN